MLPNVHIPTLGMKHKLRHFSSMNAVSTTTQNALGVILSVICRMKLTDIKACTYTNGTYPTDSACPKAFFKVILTCRSAQIPPFLLALQVRSLQLVMV